MEAATAEATEEEVVASKGAVAAAGEGGVEGRGEGLEAAAAGAVAMAVAQAVAAKVTSTSTRDRRWWARPWWGVTQGARACRRRRLPPTRSAARPCPQTARRMTIRGGVRAKDHALSAQGKAQQGRNRGSPGSY